MLSSFLFLLVVSSFHCCFDIVYAIPHADVCRRIGKGRAVDYVIVGGGPAGFVLYNKLSEDTDTTVVLLEAGPDGSQDERITTPGLAPFNIDPVGNEFVWNFTSTGGASGVELAQGRLLGGGSSVNYNTYCRGAPSVFDEWARVSGDPGLRWDKLISDFKATTHFARDPTSTHEQVIDSSVYGTGPLEVTHFATFNGFDPSWGQTLMSEFELPEIDMNGGRGQSIGVSFGTATIRVSNGTRDYALPAFGWPASRRPNAQIIKNAWASKIGFKGKRAVNVEYYIGSHRCLIEAGEIILSAGAINSPKLLMLSGVGPRDHLRRHGISVIENIPAIGGNFRDHGISGIEVAVSSNVSTLWQLLNNATFAANAEREYISTGDGILGQNGAGAYAVVRVPDSVFRGTGRFHTSLPADRGHLLFQYVNGAALPGPNISIVSPFVSLVQPEASGTVRLASRNFRDDPVVNANYYGTPGDRAAMLWGYKKLRSMMTADTMSAVVLGEVYPGDNVTSDADLWTAIEETLHSFHHPVGTISMGSVLDKDFRIKGLKGIRVVDSSTFPSPPTCAIQADVYALANRAARRIQRGT